MKRFQYYGVSLSVIPVILSLILSSCINPLFAESAILPSFQVYSLSNDRIVTTHSLIGEQGAFFAIGFNPSKQEEIEQWMQKVNILKNERSLGKIIEVAVIESRYKAFHNQVAVFMRKAAIDKSLIPFIYSGYANTSTFKSTLNIKSSKETAYFYCNPKGQILWFTTEPFNDNDFKVLSESLKLRHK